MSEQQVQADIDLDPELLENEQLKKAKQRLQSPQDLDDYFPPSAEKGGLME